MGGVFFAPVFTRGCVAVFHAEGYAAFFMFARP